MTAVIPPHSPPEPHLPAKSPSAGITQHRSAGAASTARFSEVSNG